MGRQTISSFRELCALVREDYATHGRSGSPGFRAIAIHRFGNWVNGLKPRIVRAPFSLIYWRLQRRASRVYGIELDPQAEIGRRFLIGHQGAIVIGPKVQIGDDVTIRQGATIGKSGNPRRDVTRPVIGDRVDIGVGAVIIGGLVVGHDTLIGPNVVVRRDVPPFSAVQPPDPIIRQRTQPALDPTAPPLSEQRQARMRAAPAAE